MILWFYTFSNAKGPIPVPTFSSSSLAAEQFCVCVFGFVIPVHSYSRHCCYTNSPIIFATQTNSDTRTQLTHAIVSLESNWIFENCNKITQIASKTHQVYYCSVVFYYECIEQTVEAHQTHQNVIKINDKHSTGHMRNIFPVRSIETTICFYLTHQCEYECVDVCVTVDCHTFTSVHLYILRI